MPDFFTGFVDAFQTQREQEYERNYKEDAARRAGESKIFDYLLASEDPEMRALALSGMFESTQPGARKKGLSGYMGQIQGGKVYPQILARMNEMVPDTSTRTPTATTPTPSASPGSAAMSTNQMTRPGSAPPAMPPNAPTSPFMSQNAMVQSMQPGAGPQEVPGSEIPAPPGGMPPPAPPPSIYKRRGTGVPTAEEIAEAKSRADIVGMGHGIEDIFQGSSPEVIERAKLGRLGTPQSQRTMSAVNWGVRLEPGGPIVPVLLDQEKGYVTSGGVPIPPGAERVALTGGGAGVPRTAKEPDANSSTGWSRVFYDTATGQELYRHDDTPFVPPPAFAGVSTGVDASGNPTTFGIPRGGGAPQPLMPAFTGQPTAEQSDAKALLTVVDKAIADSEAPKNIGGVRKPLTPEAKDNIVRQRATANGGNLPYTTYLELQRAAGQQRRPSATPTTATPPATPGKAGTALSMADQIRADLLSNSKRGGGGVTAPPPPPGPGR